MVIFVEFLYNTMPSVNYFFKSNFCYIYSLLEKKAKKLLKYKLVKSKTKIPY